MDMMENDDRFVLAKEYFLEGLYEKAEPVLNQIILNGSKNHHVFYMLGTIFYDQGKFNKAIKAFKRSLEISPSFTDSSVGLSIILNDLGRYDEGKKVFEEAKLMLSLKNKDDDPYIDHKLSAKHDELGDLYLQYERFEEAIAQYKISFKLNSENESCINQIIKCYSQMNEADKAIAYLTEACALDPVNHVLRLKLGKTLYDSLQVTEAVYQWEEVLRRAPNNRQAKDYLRLAQSLHRAPHL